ncbi:MULTISPECIES: DUF4365 domain-containing protein [unclassified Pseudomonas]|uniref:DUF4365 domain-containing protein n=1 Tax=unclassified Pseudomonas TaxID=196821 RepID=UPI0015A0EE10|nr:MULTISPECIES: DUF4365 domain-containing protein [unclassified Pseudomonas]NWC91066.1 DUF4365 domain-containing protein [Pseudomonas sp. IPO3779]NWD16545.1 DUF4365 domain-containing protein [Pseudomonas sp. IPO3778]
MTEAPYPDRSSSHITDNAAKNILRSALSPAWMLRDLSENDYGIDFLLEFASPENRILGQVVAIQLKGTESSGLQDEDHHRVSIKTSTLNMWLNYEMPVFLVLVDAKSGCVYLKSIEEEVRKNHRKYDSVAAQSVSFNFSSADVFRAEGAIAKYEYAKRLRRMDHDLISITSLHHDFVRLHVERYRRDEEGPVDGDGSYNPSNPLGYHKYERKLRDIYKRMQRTSTLIGITWSIPSIERIVADGRWYPDWGNEMHEVQFSSILDYLDDQMQTICGELELIISKYRDYWLASQPELVQFAETQHPQPAGMHWSERSKLISSLW